MTTDIQPTLLGRIGRAWRNFAKLYANARLMQARWESLSQLDPHTLRDVNGDRFAPAIEDFIKASTPPANANDDQESRRAA